MNNLEQDNANNIEAVRARLLSGISQVLKTISGGAVPAVKECEDLQKAINSYVDYIEAINRTSVSSEKTLTVPLANDDTEKEIDKEAVVYDMLQDPVYLSILFHIGLRKIVRTDQLAFPAEKTEILLQKRYIATISLNINDKSMSYYVLTTKGWSCFADKSISQQLQKRIGISALLIPKQFAGPQNTWTEKMFLRTVFIQRYFEENESGKDFMIFSFPENPQLQFGCLSDGFDEVRYVTAVLDDDYRENSNIEMIQTVISNSAVNKLLLISYSEKALLGIKKEISAKEMPADDIAKLCILPWGVNHE